MKLLPKFGWGMRECTPHPLNVLSLVSPPFQPEGSVLCDRFKSLQKRSLIEPRERAK